MTGKKVFFLAGAALAATCVPVGSGLGQSLSGSAPDIMPLLLERGQEGVHLAEDGSILPDDGTIAASTQRSRITVPVSFGGLGPYPFLVDTGAETTVLSRQLAAELGLVGRGSKALVGSVDRARVEHVDISAFQIGKHQLDSRNAVLLDGRHLGAAGILGIDSLRDYRVIFDFARSEITITQSRTRRETSFSPRRTTPADFEVVFSAQERADRMVLSTATIDGVPVKVVIDTGSNISVGNTALRRQLRRANTVGTTAIYDVTGAGVARDVIIANSIRFGSIRLAKSAIIINDSPAFEELGMTDEPAILLGMNHLRAFRRIAVDFSRREISFDLKV